MSEIRNDFKDYKDGNGLYAPSPVPEGEINVTGNGVMYYSEYIIMLKKLNIINAVDYRRFFAVISYCEQHGMLNRYPLIHNSDQPQEGPDDYIALSNACIELKNTSLPRKFLKSIFSYFGFLNNVDPGKPTASSFLIRQPQFLSTLVNAAFPSLKNPIHYLVRAVFLPVYLMSAVYILINGLSASSYEVDGRRKGWHVQNNLKKTSFLCFLASKVWFRRLKNDYKNGMKGVADIYYQPNYVNPYAKWWQE